MLIIKENLSLTIDSLRESDKTKLFHLLSIIELNGTIFEDTIKHKITKLNLPGSTFYIFKLSHDLRVLIKLEDDKIIIQDIFNHDRMEKYFKNYLGGGLK